MTDHAAPETPPVAPEGVPPDRPAEKTASFAPRPAAPAPGEKTASFAPRPGAGAQAAGQTASFAPRPAAAPQPPQWNAPPGAGVPPEPGPGPSFTLDVQGATSPVPAPLSTQTFMPAVASASPAAAAEPPAMPGPPPVGPPGPAFAIPAPPAEASPAPVFPVAAPAHDASGPALPARPSTLTAAFAFAVVQALAMVVSGAILLLQANGGGDWLQSRLDDWNRKHSATTLDAVQHAVDVAGAGAIAFGVVVLILAASSLYYGWQSRILLAVAEVVIIALAALGVLATPLSLAFAVLPIVVLALILAPQTSRAFADARDAQEEWQAS